MTITFFFGANLTYDPSSLSMSIDNIISEICNSRIKGVILIGNRTTLLDYGH